MSFIGRRFAERGLERHHVVLLLLLGAAAFFDGYDTAVKAVALKQIRETFDLDPSGGSAMLAIITLGAVPALALTRLADRVGRRTMLLWTVVGFTLFSGLTALTPNWQTFAAVQLIANVFIVAESAIVWTYAAEELPAEARGLGFGLIGMNIALGTGLAPLLYGPLHEGLGLSWRWMYVVAVPPLLLVAGLRRGLGESRRFERARDDGNLAQRWQDILAPSHRRWLGLVVVTTFLFAMTYQVGTVAIDWLQSERDMSATLAGNMMVLGGLPGIPIMVMAGRWSDRFGRRLVGCGFAVLGLVGGAGFFWLPDGTGAPALLPFMSMMLIGTMGSFPVLQTFVTELFPTSVRGSATAWSSTSAIVGRTASLGIAAVLLKFTDQTVTTTVLALGPIVGIVMVARLFPDTHGRELEETSGELQPTATATPTDAPEEPEEPEFVPLLT
ncbi:MAG TPA: MFS transporter [Acidimicrobiales bacterium]|nr:MFS transporter [Acidimicrobiales bacterium]